MTDEKYQSISEKYHGCMVRESRSEVYFMKELKGQYHGRFAFFYSSNGNFLSKYFFAKNKGYGECVCVKWIRNEGPVPNW